MAKYDNLGGTSQTSFKVGLDGPTLKRQAADALDVRNEDDSDYAAIRAALVQVFGDDIELNAGSAGSGADWKYTIRRKSTGMTMDVVLELPTDGAPTTGFALVVTGAAGGVVTLGYASVASGTDSKKVDTTSLGFGTGTPVAMFNRPANAVVDKVRVIIDTPFDGTPTVSVGITGTTAKYMPTTAVDLTAAAGTVFEFSGGVPAAVGAESLIATYSAGGATVGAARIETEYHIPS